MGPAATLERFRPGLYAEFDEKLAADLQQDLPRRRQDDLENEFDGDLSRNSEQEAAPRS